MTHRTKRVFIALSAAVIACWAAAEKVYSAPAPKLSAACAILQDAGTGQVLFEKNSGFRKPMASTTKIMTAIIVLENCSMDEVVAASENASKTPFTGLGLKPGEEMTVRDLLTAMLIRSANDAAVALAEHTAGSVEKFAEMMNKKAAEIGAKDTHFVNPNGLFAKGHYSTARDLALITRYALQIPEFNEIIKQTQAHIERSMNHQDCVVISNSRFLKTYYGADGVKSGYTKEAGRCFVGSATRNGWRLLSVVLKSCDSQADTAALMDYGFTNFRKLTLASPNKPAMKTKVIGGTSELELVPSKELYVIVQLKRENLARVESDINRLAAPIKKGDRVGMISAYLGDKKIASAELLAANDVEQSYAAAALGWLSAIGLPAAILMSMAYGRTTAKDISVSRRRITQKVRRTNIEGTSFGKRQDS